MFVVTLYVNQHGAFKEWKILVRLLERFESYLKRNWRHLTKETFKRLQKHLRDYGSVGPFYEESTGIKLTFTIKLSYFNIFIIKTIFT